MKIHPVGAELFHADGQTDRHDEAKTLFVISRNRPKNIPACSKHQKVSEQIYMGKLKIWTSKGHY